MQENTESYLTAVDFKNLAKLSLPYIRLLTQKKQITHIRVGRRVLYRLSDIQEFLDSRLVTTEKDEVRNDAR